MIIVALWHGRDHKINLTDSNLIFLWVFGHYHSLKGDFEYTKLLLVCTQVSDPCKHLLFCTVWWCKHCLIWFKCIFNWCKATSSVKALILKRSSQLLYHPPTTSHNACKAVAYYSWCITTCLPCAKVSKLLHSSSRVTHRGQQRSFCVFNLLL